MSIKLISKYLRKQFKICFQPISVYCLHHVTEQFDSAIMNQGDWMALNEFEININHLRRDGVKFISLTDAYQLLKNDCIRIQKYAVLAFDDGYASLKEVIPWLEEQKIPVVLFINGKYLDGISYRKNPNEKYLTYEELFDIDSPLIEIGSHGYEHTDASIMSEDVFRLHIENNIEVLSSHPRYISFHAYTWGRHTEDTDHILQSMNITPVYIDGMKNYNEPSIIHRELL